MFRLVVGSRPFRAASDSRAYSSLANAVAGAKALYALVPAHITIWQDNGDAQPLKDASNWTYIDAIKPSSWAAGGLTISEYFALVRGGEQDNDDAEGPAVVDDEPYLEVYTDGYACVCVDWDDGGNLAPGTPAPGAWTFRVGGVGPFDAPDAPNRNLGTLAVNTLVEAQDAQGELPTLSALVPADSYPYPVPLATWGVVTPAGLYALPQDTSDDDPLGSPVVVVHDADGVVGYDESATKYDTLDGQDPDLVHNAPTGDYRLAQMFVARPFTPLPDDDGHSPGYWLRRIEMRYTQSVRYVQATADGDGGMYTSRHDYYADPAQLPGVVVNLSYGLQSVPTWQESMGTDTSGDDGTGHSDGWHVSAGAVPESRDIWPDAAHYWQTFPDAAPQRQVADRIDYQGWSAEGYLRAVYVQRDAAGEEWEYLSEATPVSVNLARYRQYPMIPTHYKPNVSTNLSGCSGGDAWTEENGGGLGTPFWEWQPEPGDAYGIRGTYLPGDSLSWAVPGIQGATAYHMFVFRQGTQYAISAYTEVADPASGTSPCFPESYSATSRCTPNSDPLGYLLANGVPLAGSCSSIREYVGAGGLDSSQIGTADCKFITCTAWPILGGFANGGSVPYDCDTVEYRDATGTRQPDAVTGPRPATVTYHAQGAGPEAHGQLAEADAHNNCIDSTGAQGGEGTAPGLPPDPSPPGAVRVTKGKMRIWAVTNVSQTLPEFLQAEVLDSYFPSTIEDPAHLRQGYFLLYASQAVVAKLPGFGVIGFRGSVPDGEGGIDYTDPVLAKGPYTAYINCDADLTGCTTLAEIATAMAGQHLYIGAEIIGEAGLIGVFDYRGSSAGDDRLNPAHPQYLVAVYKHPQKIKA